MPKLSIPVIHRNPPSRNTAFRSSVLVTPFCYIHFSAAYRLVTVRCGIVK